MRLVPTLWFVAAGLAFLAVGIRVVSDGVSNVPTAAGGLFCLVMGIVALRNSKRPTT